MKRRMAIVVAVVGWGLTALSPAVQAEPRVIPLWPGAAPGAVGEEQADKPTLTVYPASGERRTATAVVICPGGGYGHLAVDHEGVQIAEWLNGLGIHAFVLRYRIAPRYHHPAPMQDVQRAIRLVRSRAEEFGIHAERIGIIGFSAGGHLASTAATHFDGGKTDAADPVERAGCRPDFAILCYPVISMQPPFVHAGSRRNLLGESPDPTLIEKLSNDTQVNPRTPPTFLFHTTDDPVVAAENSVLFYLALRKAKVPAELHIYAHGRHGVGLAKQDPVLGTWPKHCEDWLRGLGMLKN